MKRTVTLLALAAALAGLGMGCRKPKTTEKGVTAAQLLSTADRAMKQGKFDEARRSLRVLEENLPGSAEFPRAKIMLGDSYFFQGSPSYPEAEVEYQSFLNYFPRHELRDYALYHKALCHFSSIESAERDQAETRKALTSFQQLLAESPGSPYATEAKSKIVQCWRRLAEHELQVGIYYVNTYYYPGAERRLKDLLVTYPDYVDRERVYYYLGETMRQRSLSPAETQPVQQGLPRAAPEGQLQRADQKLNVNPTGRPWLPSPRSASTPSGPRPRTTTRSWWRAIPSPNGPSGPPTA